VENGDWIEGKTRWVTVWNNGIFGKQRIIDTRR
jgi:hypothetical protein